MIVMVADDEAIERRAISQILNSACPFVDRIIEAQNGREAVAMALQHRPQLIFMDIKMPGIDGLEASRMIGEVYQPHIIIISAYSEFTFAQSAIRVGVLDYILKPVRPETMQEVTTRVYEQVLEESRMLQASEELKENLDHIKPLAENNLVYQLIWGKDNREDILKQFKILSLKHRPALAMAVLAETPDITDYNDELFERKSQFYGAVRDALADIDSAVCAPVGNAGVAVLLPAPPLGQPFKEYVMAKAEGILWNIGRHLETSIKIGIGRRCESISDIPISYKEALAALQHRFYTEANQIVYVEDIFDPSADRPVQAYPLHLENLLISRIMAGDTTSSLEAFDNLLESVIAGDTRPQQLIARMLELVALVSRNLIETTGDNSLSGSELSDLVIPGLYKAKSFKVLQDMMRLFVIQASQKMSSGSEMKYSEDVRMVLSILQSSYSTTFSLQDLASQVHLSPCYLSKMFKNQTGQTITDYLTNLRVCKAQEMLSSQGQGKFTINEIAFKVGYTDPNYFTRVFHKVTGVTPKAYQKRA